MELAQFLSEKVLDKYPKDEFLLYGDIVINSTGTGTLGRVGCYDIANDNVVPDSHITTIRPSDEIDKQYVYTYLKSMQSVLEKSGEGSTNQKELKPDTIKQLIVPIPSLKEQQKIIQKTTLLNEQINAVEVNLN